MLRRPERYQLAFDLRPRQEDGAAYRAIWQGLSNELNESRFVRTVQERVVVRTPQDVATHLLTQIFAAFDSIDQEELWVLLLNTRNRITHEVLLYRGTLDAVSVRPAEVFKEAIRFNSSGILLAHNHPSGDPTPSPQDVTLTQNILQVAALLQINLLDHIVVGQKRWFSLKERGLAFPPNA